MNIHGNSCLTGRDAHACLPTYIHTYMHSNTHTQKDIHTCLSIYIHTYLHGNIHAYICDCLAKHIHKHMNTDIYIHTKIYTY